MHRRFTLRPYCVALALHLFLLGRSNHHHPGGDGPSSSPVQQGVAFGGGHYEEGVVGDAITVMDGCCVGLTGIVSGGGEGVLDLDIVSKTVAVEPFDFTTSDPISAIVPTLAACSAELTTPVSMRHLLSIDTAVFSVSNMFRPGSVALDIFGDKETSDARRRCQSDSSDSERQELYDLHLRVAVLYTLVYGGLVGIPFCRELIEPLMDSSGLPLSLVFDGADPSVNTPWGLAKTYYDEINSWMTANDGWNADGSANREYNRVPFSDYAITDSEGNSWTPYIPRNSPWKIKKPKRWQPLTESDGRGYIFSREHVTPYIGATARYLGFESNEDEEAFAFRELDDPDYKYTSASIAVLEETRDTVGNDFKLGAIEFFHNKFASLIPLKILYFLREADTLTALDFYRVTVEVQLAIYNGVVLVWKEKIRHDLPRPQTVIDYYLGDEKFETYAGPGEGVQWIKASEWEPFIRTMPHSEFPSASACICQVFAEQVVRFLGSDELDPPLDVELLVALGTKEFKSWSEMSDTCADSRVWGGMHFTEAATAGTKLCGGGLLAPSISSSIGALIDGDESAAIFKKDVGEQMVRPLIPGSAKRNK